MAFARLFRQGSGYWEIEIRVQSCSRQQEAGRNGSESNACRNRNRSATLHNHHGGKLLEAWMRHLRSLGRAHTTIYGYEWRIRKHLVPAIGNLPVAELAAKHLNDLYGRLLKESAPATVRQTHAIIRKALDQAERWGWVARNVAVLATAEAERVAHLPAPLVVQHQIAHRLPGLTRQEFVVNTGPRHLPCPQGTRD
ncbi:MAG: hypothetical protein EPN30_03330 [Actinomycetota bacterium]|nr:MAG: hypothetical protein EPN30_03330 [Actinomycetota bacterium]